MLKIRKLIHISRIQILLTLILFLLLFFDRDIIPMSLAISFIHCFYRIFSYRTIDNLRLELKYEKPMSLLLLKEHLKIISPILEIKIFILMVNIHYFSKIKK